MPLSHISYRDVIPPELSKQLIDIYQSVFCLTDYFSIYHNAVKPHAIAIYSDRPNPDHIIYYAVSGKEACVLNQYFDIDFLYLDYLVKILFANYQGLHTIHIDKFKSDLKGLSYPYKIWDISHDNIVELPATMAEYRANLGKRTRANLSNYYNKLRREFQNFSFSIVCNEEIDQAVISRIIEMHRSRMLAKKSSSAIDGESEKKIIQLAGNHGIVGIITINDCIAAGTICYKVGTHCYSDVIALDPKYSRYSIGRVCIYLMIEALIDRNVRYYHMGFGDAEYKGKMGSVRHDVYHASIFRTKLYEITGQVKYLNKYKLIKLYSNMIKYNYFKRFKALYKNRTKTD